MNFLKNLILQEFGGIANPGGVRWALWGDDPVDYITLVLEVIIGLAGLAAVAFIVFGAYTLITAGGEPENVTKGQKMIQNAIIGLVIAALAFVIVNFVIDSPFMDAP